MIELEDKNCNFKKNLGNSDASHYFLYLLEKVIMKMIEIIG